MTPGAPPPLPIPVRPHTGEHPTDYLHRLAEANHLRPAALRLHINESADPRLPLRLDRFAAISGRSVHGLRKALTGQTPESRPRLPGLRRRIYPRILPAATLQQQLKRDLQLAADEIRYHDQIELFATIRADAQRTGASAQQLANRHLIGVDLVREILRGRDPRSPQTDMPRRDQRAWASYRGDKQRTPARLEKTPTTW